MKKVLYVVAQDGFRDEEYFTPKEIFENNSIEVVTTSVEAGIAKGSKGGETTVDVSLADAQIEDFSALVICGGPGAMSLDGNDELNRLIFDALRKSKIVAAICVAPVILGTAGVLAGVSVTVWNDEQESQSKFLYEKGAILFDEDVVVEGPFVTANGPHAAKEFGMSILDAIEK